MQFISKINKSFFAGLLIVGFFCTSSWAAENVEDLSTQNLGMEIGDTVDTFEYKLDERPDPFLPFISKGKAQKITKDEIIEEDEVLTGMRLFEPGQLTLVAVMSLQNRQMAMVQDVTGRGYILDEGMLIGRRGIVSSIEGDQVTVIETSHTRAGRIIKKKIAMRLKKEGDI